MADRGSPAIALANAIGVARFAMFRAASLVAHPGNPGFGMRTSEKNQADARTRYREQYESQPISRHEVNLEIVYI
jgi:hypothetical protein